LLVSNQFYDQHKIRESLHRPHQQVSRLGLLLRYLIESTNQSHHVARMVVADISDSTV